MYIILAFVTIYLVYNIFNKYKEPFTTKNKTCATFNCHKTHRVLKADAETIDCGVAGCNDCKCCDPGKYGKCKKDFPCCINDKLIKKNKNQKCVGKKCNDSECCEEKHLPTCYGDYDAQQLPERYSLKPNQQDITCKKHKCTTKECAEPYPQCSTFNCPEFSYNADKQCGDAICQKKDCCLATSYCTNYECPDGFKSRGLNKQCSKKDCTEKECCVKKKKDASGGLFGGCSITEYGCCPGTQTPSNYGGFNCPKPKEDGKNLIRKVKKKYYEGNDIFIFTEKPPPIEEKKEEDWAWRHGSDYHRSYRKTINHYPKESIRFDLISPIPYNDAYIAPMGPKYGTWTPQ